MTRTLLSVAAVVLAACASVPPMATSVPAEEPLVILVTPEEKAAMDARVAAYAVPAECPDGAPTEPNAQPLVRKIPIFPPDAGVSGSCEISFNVNPNGLTKDVVATACTDDIFMRPSKRSVQRYEYEPRLKDGQPASICGVRTKVSFRLMDENGVVVPE